LRLRCNQRARERAEVEHFVLQDALVVRADRRCRYAVGTLWPKKTRQHRTCWCCVAGKRRAGGKGIAGGIAGVHAAHCFLKGFLSGEQAGQRIAFARVGFWRMGRHTGMVQVAAACTVWDMRVGAMAVLHTTPWGLQLAGTIILLNFHFNKRFQK
jgi:hypothetical protein